MENHGVPHRSDEDPAAVRSAFVELLTGGDAADPADPDIRAKIAEIDGAVRTYLDELERTAERSAGRATIWNDLPLQANSYAMTLTFKRLATMAIACRTRGSAFCGDRSVEERIADALARIRERVFNESAEAWGNWWDWQIGSPIEILKCLALLFDRLPPDIVRGYVHSVRKHTPFRSTVKPGDANELWLLFNRLLAAVIVGDAAEAGTVMKTVNTGWFGYTSEKDGFHRDGSYIMHGHYPYTGSYGVSLIETLAKITYIVDGTPWAVETDNKLLAAQWIRQSYAPLLYRGAMMDMVRGRTIARKSEGDHLIGHVVIRSVFLLSLCLPPDDAGRLQSQIKRWIMEDTARSIYEGDETINNNNSVFFIAKLKRLMKNDVVAPSRKLSGCFLFPAMDRIVLHRPGHAFGVSMHSRRIANYESINGENIRGWHTADGMTYLYNGDLTQFSGNFWPTVDPYRLPGTTVERQTAVPAGKTNGSSWVGGTDLGGTYGVAGMVLQPFGQSLHAKKSWFLFDDEIVALGSDIGCADGKNIETIVENRKLNDDGGGMLTVNGVPKPPETGWSETMAGVRWMHLAGAAAGTDIGYYFPQKATVCGFRERRTGRWSDLNNRMDMGTDAPLTACYLTLWLDHGKDPAGGSYAYVLLPNKSAAQVAAYAARPGIAILENSAEVHAVKQCTLNMIGVNFWTDAVKNVDFITCDKKASVMIRETAEEMEISVSDPTQENDGVINLELARSASGVIARDPQIEVVRLHPTVRLAVHVGGQKGRSLKAAFSMLLRR